jgi:hypothetical protein
VNTINRNAKRTLKRSILAQIIRLTSMHLLSTTSSDIAYAGSPISPSGATGVNFATI